MDLRTSSQHPFSRPQSHQELRDPRYSSIPPPPPPPYSSRSSNTRPDILHSGDPFLRRKVDLGPSQPGPYAVPNHSSYTANGLASELVQKNEQARRNSFGSLLPHNDGQHERYRPRAAEGDYSHPHPSPSTALQPPPPSSLFRSQPDRREPRANPLTTPSDRGPLVAMFSDHTVPPPPPYSARAMPPPSSPSHSQSQYQGQTPMSRVSHLPPSFSGSRELPALPANRPESSMSISAMLGSDPERPARESRSTAALNGSISPASVPFSSLAQTARTASSPNQREYSQNLVPYRRSPSPEKSQQRSTNRPFRAYSSDQRRIPIHSNAISPQATRFGSSFINNPPQQSIKPESAPTSEWRAPYNRNFNGGKISQRPSSQPSGRITPPNETETTRLPNSVASTAERYRELQVAQKYEKLARESRRNLSFGPADPGPQDVIEERIRRAKEERAAISVAQHSPSRDSIAYAVPRGRSAAQQSTSNKRPYEEIDNVDRVYNSDPRAFSNSSQSPFSPDSLRRLREERLNGAASQQDPTSQPTIDSPNRTPGKPGERPSQILTRIPNSLGLNMNRSISTNGIERQGGKVSDDTVQQRHSIATLIENNKRGRVSPFPQAVQGAQGRNSGPASDPGIKNEFARMFSGIGSGVGSSGPMGSGSSTPFPGSPKANQEPERRTPMAVNRGEFGEIVWPRQGSRNAKRGRSLKDDETKANGNNGDSPALISRTAFQTASLNDNPSGFTNIPTPLPKYEGKENCTLTVRVPRFYLEDVEREEITRRRALWGCDIYTDDSDPVAAAIHAGWIQGAWGPDIDISMLEVDDGLKSLKVQEEGEKSHNKLNNPPTKPVVPPRNKDMLLALRVLPALEGYLSVTRHGIRSRSWGSEHDGISFMIEGVEFVEHGAEERGGEARRKRMRTKRG
ncbi:MAG: hypothetical protein Q9167_003621, partial [Letrouitia subvulpina]